MAGKVVTTAAPTKQEAAAVRNYVGRTAKANPGTSRAVEKAGSDARNVNYYRGAADPESKKKKDEAREAAQRDRNLAARMEGNGQQAQFQQEAQQQQQEQAPETTFTDEANKGKGQTEQQEATRYTQEANADPARTLAETAEGKQKGSAWAKQRADEASTELADLQADRLRVSQLYENGEPPSEQTLQALGLKTLEEYDDEIGKAEEQANYYEQLAREADGSKGFLEGLKERHAQQMENMSKQSDNWWEDPQASWAFLSGGNEVDDQVSGWAKQFASGPVQAVGTGLQWFDQSSDDMVRHEYDQEHGEGAYDRAIAGKNVNQVGQLGDKLWDVGTNLYESGQEDWERGTENMSDTGKTIANIAKTGMDVVGDAALNAFAPGLGTMRMYLGAAGNGSYEQSQRENNDIDSRAVAMVKNGLNAYLSNKLLGGLETVYGQSVLGGLTDDLLKNASPQVQKTLKVLLNSEGLEEGLEDILNWGGDIILGLDTGKPLDWNEVKQDAFIGYVLGVVTNGLAGGMNIDSKMQENIARGGIEFGEKVASGEISGIEEAAEIGLRNTSNNVTMKPGADANVEAEAETSAPEAEAPGGETPAPVRAVQPEMDETGVAWTGDWDSWVDTALSGGAISETDVNTIYSKPEARRAFEEITGTSLEGMTEEEAKATIGMAAGTTTRVEPVAEGNISPEAKGNPETEAPQPDETATLAGTAEGQNPNAESTAPENGAETLANAAEGQSRVNTPGNAENAVEGGLNRSETNDGNNPLVTAAEGGNLPTGNGGETGRVLTNGSGEEKVSQYYSNTMTKTGEANDVDPILYNVKSESESVANAATRLNRDYQGMINHLLTAEAWSGEMVDAAAIVAHQLRMDARRTGDMTAYNDWKRIQSAKQRESARGIQAIAKQSRPASEGVLDAARNEFDAIRKANAEAEKAGRTKDIIPEEVLQRAETKINELSDRMLDLEIQMDDDIRSGVSEADAQAKVKEAYLDIIDEINTFRHTGLFQDMGKHANVRAEAKAQKKVQKLNTRFRRMLSNEGMDYIMRFAACDAAGISEDVHYKGKQDFMKRLNTWQKLAQLTGTGTWLRNGVGNGSFGIVDVLSADNPVTLLTDALISLKTGKRSSGFETGIVNRSARDAAAHALNRSILEVAANIDLSTDSDTTKYDMGRTRTYDPDSENVLTRIGSRWEQWNGYMLQSSDAWFKGMAEGSVESSVRRANRWGEDNLTDTERSSMDPEKATALTKKRQAELDEVKKQVADYRTFQNDGITAKAATEVRDWFNQKGGEIGKIFDKNGWQNGQFGLGTALMPYVKVPTNLAVKSLEFSPAGAAKGVAEIVKVMTDPNATMAQQNKAVTDFGRGLTGTAIIWGLTELMRNAKWFRDWNDEEDKDVKAQNRAEGKSGIQLNLDMMHRQASGDKSGEWRNGDRVIDISSMEPFNQLITTAGLIAKQENPTLKDVGQAFWTSSRDSVMGMPALQAIANIEDSIRYTETPEDGLATAANTIASTVGNVAGGMVPGPVRHIAQVTDDKQRDTSGNNPIERTVNTVKSSIPGLRETLPVKTDAYGNEQSAGDFTTRFANQYDAFKHNQVNQSEVSREVERIREETGESHVPARNGPKSVTFGSGSGKEQVKLTAEERKDYRDANGQDFSRSMEELMKDPVYLLADDDTKELLMAEAESYANDGAKLNLAEKHDIDFESKYADYREMEDPVEVLAAQTAYSTAKKDEDWDAVDALLKTIQRGDGRISEEGMDFMIGKDSKINYYTYLADKGVPTKRAKAFEEDLKDLYTSEKRNDSRSTDMIRVAGNGKYTEKEADAIMGYEREVSDESRQRYQDQLAWNLEKAGKSGMYNEVWSRIEAVETGDMENADFKKWVDKNIPLEQRKSVKDIASNLAEDRHAAGKYVSSFYGAAREIGCTPEQALQFFEHIDTNYNGSYTKKEIRNAVKWAFGSGQNAKDVTAYLKERGIL